MRSTSNPTNTLLPRAVAALLACVGTGCAAPRAIPPAPPALAPEIAGELAAKTAAARAIVVSPRVAAAALRLEASAQRATGVDAPPDPSVAISLGVPIDGLGGFPISASLMQGIGWLLNRDAIRDASARERELAARELLATTVEVAADARRLVRTLDAAREATRARELAARAQHERLDAARAAADLREATPARIRALEIAANDADERLIAARTAEAEATRALASLLALADIGAVARDEPVPPPGETLTSLEVARARSRVARAAAALAAADTPLGADARAGASYSRDIEDRESVAGTLELTLPLFRRGHELAALRADLAAEEAELREAERVARLEAERFGARVDAARHQLDLASRSARAARHAREIAENALAEGEASRVEVADARTAEGEALAHAAETRTELAEALAMLESRITSAAAPMKETKP